MVDVNTFNGTGSDCSGSSGGSNRVLTLSNTRLTQQAGLLVYASGLALALTTEYTVSHLAASTTITFLNPLWDDMTVVVSYYTTGTGNDFETGPLNDLGVDVVRTPVTETNSNIGGQKNYAEGSDETITVVFSNITKGYFVDNAGETVSADALMFAQDDQTINKHDIITYSGNTYRVDSVSDRDFDGELMFKRAILFLTS